MLRRNKRHADIGGKKKCKHDVPTDQCLSCENLWRDSLTMSLLLVLISSISVCSLPLSFSDIMTRASFHACSILPALTAYFSFFQNFLLTAVFCCSVNTEQHTTHPWLRIVERDRARDIKPGMLSWLYYLLESLAPLFALLFATKMKIVYSHCLLVFFYFTEPLTQ
jgi:hypothetical protein